MKVRATGLLVLAAAVFVIVQRWGGDRTWVGFVRAGSEAAMVGGLADWFAVTALFRHPLRLPIPHTAIIPKRKDEIGANLGQFVQENFLQAEMLAERLAGSGLAQRLGEWLATPANARLVGEQAAEVVTALTEVLNDEDVRNALESTIASRLRTMPVAPLTGRALDLMVEGQHHQIVLDTALGGIDRLLTDNDEVFRSRLRQESPWWVPEPVDDRVFDKLIDVIGRFVSDVAGDPDHELRKLLDTRAVELAEELKESPELRARGEALKEEMLAHPEVRAWVAGLWDHIKASLNQAAHDPHSELRSRLEAAIVSGGRSLIEDPALQEKVDRWAVSVTTYVAEQGKGEVAKLISSTVERWDADETSDRIELQVGRDLQFIRINGTLVGGVAGVAIHAISLLL